MTRSNRTGRRWVKRIAVGGGVAVVAAAAITRWERARSGPPWDSSASNLPDGDDLRVRADDGVELAVRVAGPADGPAVVLSHCWVGSRSVWGPVAQRLVEQRHRVVLYDQRGHGESGDLSTTPSIAQLGDDLRAVADALDVRDAVFAGHSMGGMSVQSYAVEHPVDFKERARAVVLVSTAAKVTGRPLPEPIVTRLMGEGSRDWARRGTLGYALARRSLGRIARRADVELTLDGLARTTGAARAGFMTAMSTMDLRPGLAGIDVPATVMVGSRDRLTPPRAARALAAGIGRANLVTLPSVGHMLPLEAADEVAGAIADAACAV